MTEAAPAPASTPTSATTQQAPRAAAALAGVEHTLVFTSEGTPCFDVAREHVHDALQRLRDRAGFAQCTFVTAIDLHPREPRFQVAWQLLSLEHNERVRVRTLASGHDPRVPTATDLWPGANWSERECFDMFGIRFDGHPDLRRLLMPKGYDHFPLRKEFPHAGIEPDKLYREWDEARRREEGMPA